MEIPQIEAVEQANRGFYRAFESLDIIEMGKVWAQGEPVRCVHPGWALLQGWEEVMGSWQRIFENATMMQFTITGLEVTVEGAWAWVACTENIMSVNDAQVAESRVQATNIYKLGEGKWLMVHHHGSPMP